MGRYKIYDETLASNIDVLNNVSKTVTLDIPQDKDIQKIYIRLSGTCSGTLSVWNEDNPMNLIKNVQLRGGKDIIFDVGMPTLWQLNAYDFGIVPERVALTIAGNTSFSALASYNFMKNARNPLDVSSVLPARDYPNLKLRCQIGAATDMATGITLSAAVADVKLTTVDPNPLGLKFENRDIIRLTEKDIDITGANSTYKDIDVDSVGYKIRRIVVKSIDNSLRSDAFVTNCRILDRKYNNFLVDDKWMLLKNQDIFDYTLNPREYWNSSATIAYVDPIGTDPSPKGTIRGITVMDFDKARNTQYSMLNFLDLRNYKIGDMKLGFINSAGSGTRKLTKVEEYVTTPSV